MKKKILNVMIVGVMTTLPLTTNTYAQINYQNQPEQQYTTQTNTTPTTEPNSSVVNNQSKTDNTKSYVNQNGQTVYQTTTEQEEKYTPEKVDYQNMSATEKFWNISNEQIRDIKRKYKSKTAALEQDVSPSQCYQSTVNVTNAPGANVPVIRLDSKNIATVLITDAYGKPWSVDYIINNQDVNVVRDTENPEVSSFSLQSKTTNAQGNLVVKLVGNPVPVIFSYINDQVKTDCLMVAKLDKAGPNTDIRNESISSSALDSSLNSTLYGVAPKDSKQLKVSNSDATAWLLSDGKVVIRTKYKLLSPAYESVTRSPDGTFVYKTQYSPIYSYRYNDLIGSFEVKK